LLSHAPFLSLYHPYISNFQTSSASLAKLRKENRTFEKWLKDREKQEECRKLRLGDWMLSVVQRVPRYRLLIAVRPRATLNNAKRKG
jgi:FYVE/RhoGEF/PH domain-containing protein 5/6